MTKQKKKITRNAAKCRLCGDVIESKSRHDFVYCECRAIAVDGGNAYFRRVGNPENYIELNETEPA